MKSLYSKIAVSLLILFSTPLASHAQCAMCRAALMSGDNQSAAEGINHGITYLMVFPYVLVGIIAFGAYRIIKKESNPE